mmetsp:Transcript_12557/g.22647  ORF Transcript_12557/g.22647 Transcript_12557/m.22647 type:complete len:204 (-) Transcript_12557:958-1569(-)
MLEFRILRNALPSICLTRSFVSPTCCPTASSVIGKLVSSPNLMLSTASSRGHSSRRMTSFSSARNKRSVTTSSGFLRIVSSNTSENNTARSPCLHSDPNGTESNDTVLLAMFNVSSSVFFGIFSLCDNSSSGARRPSWCCVDISRRMRFNREMTCTGSRIVLENVIFPDTIVCRIHHDAYVVNLYPLRASNRSTPVINPDIPS